jgi:hypothetical protein
MTSWIVTAHGTTRSAEFAQWLKEALEEILSSPAAGCGGSNMDSDVHRGPLHLSADKFTYEPPWSVTKTFGTDKEEPKTAKGKK